jgi:hypothetical protein
MTAKISVGILIGFITSEAQGKRGVSYAEDA